MKPVVVIAGPMRSGKSALSRALQERFGATMFENSSLIANRLRDRGGGKKRRDYCDFAMRLIREHGYGALVEPFFTLMDAELNAGRMVVFSGPRFPEQVTLIREHFSRVVVVYVDAAFDVRFRRLTESEEKAHEYAVTREEFLEMHSWPCECRVPAIQPIADRTFIQEGDRESFAETPLRYLDLMTA